MIFPFDHCLGGANVGRAEIEVSDGKPLRDFPESTRRGRFGRGVPRLQTQRAELVVATRGQSFGGAIGPDQTGQGDANCYTGGAEKRVHGLCGVLAMPRIFTSRMRYLRAVGAAFGQQNNTMRITRPDG
ncbi:hypothetical protein CN181_28265 [Sinorhizobium medicae]|nr:hypothetical protein CN181_28265 [Sinorhizobium medicae]